MRFLLGLIFVFALAVPATVTPALAQKLPTAKEVGDVIFKEVEKRAIEEFFGKKAAEKATGGKKKRKKAKKGKGRGRGGEGEDENQTEKKSHGGHSFPPGPLKHL